MWQLLYLGIRRYSALLLQTLAAPLDPRRRFSGAVLVIALFPLLLAVQVLHWLGFLLDEVLFRGYRKVSVSEPVFVIGPPRTGTTFLHQALATDAGFTTFRLWECLFGLSVTGRKFCLGLGWLDNRIGSPFARLGRRIGRWILGPMDDIHPLALGDPEEDFLCLLPFAACFLLLVPYPNAEWLWRYARFDVDLDPSERKAVLRWYRRCIQKHLYVYGSDKQFLSKNASYCGLSHSLLDAFPDARILVTWRDPVATVPSQLSSLRPGYAACGFRDIDDELRDRLMELMLFYYLHIEAAEDMHADRVATITNDALRDNPRIAITTALAQIGIDARAELLDALDAIQSREKPQASAHKYAPEDFGLSAEEIRSRFEAVYARIDSTPNEAIV